MSKLLVVHAALIETAKRSHPRFGHKLDPDNWRSIWGDPSFQEQCNILIKRSEGWFSTTTAPSKHDYELLGKSLESKLAVLQAWPVIRAYFFVLDAEAQLTKTIESVALTELMSDVVLEELEDQVERGYLTFP
jgi:hypothetical protein